MSSRRQYEMKIIDTNEANATIMTTVRKIWRGGSALSGLSRRSSDSPGTSGGFTSVSSAGDAVAVAVIKGTDCCPFLRALWQA